MESAPSGPTPRHPAAGPENGGTAGPANLPENRPAAGPAADRPILAIDVDGVISLFGFELAPPPEVARFELIDGTPHCISLPAAERIGRLSELFEPVWATGWQDRANDQLALITGIGPLPVIEFDAGHDPGAVAGTTAAHWKLGAIASFCGARPMAWIDDSFDRSCFDWAEAREAAGSPTLLIPTEPAIGLEEAQAVVAAAWASTHSRSERRSEDSASGRPSTPGTSGEPPDPLH